MRYERWQKLMLMPDLLSDYAGYRKILGVPGQDRPIVSGPAARKVAAASLVRSRTRRYAWPGSARLSSARHW